MPKLKKPRQIKFYCTEELFRRFQSIKVTRRASTQELMTQALSLLVGYESARQGNEQLIGVLEQAVNDQIHWMTMWQECLVELPPETSDAQKRLMEDLLRFFRSSKLKAAPRRGRKRSDVQQRETSER